MAEGDGGAAVALCRDRTALLAEAIRHRYALADAHRSYAASLRDAGAALHDFLRGVQELPPAPPSDPAAALRLPFPSTRPNRSTTTTTVATYISPPTTTTRAPMVATSVSRPMTTPSRLSPARPPQAATPYSYAPPYGYGPGEQYGYGADMGMANKDMDRDLRLMERDELSMRKALGAQSKKLVLVSSC